MRRAAVAGLFYPDDPAALRQCVAECMGGAVQPDEGPPPKAIIAPHAGYQYSGPIAASAYATWTDSGSPPRRIILTGPAHRAAIRGVAVPSAAAFATPLGPVDVDDAARAAALEIDGVTVDDAAHADEHSLEVHLPFILELFGAVPVLPLLAGEPGESVAARVLDRLWGGEETRIVTSTDLSHYHDAATARALDRATAAAIVDARADAIRPEQACGAAAVRALLAAGTRHGLRVRALDVRTSADTAGDPARVVGYGAFALSGLEVG